MTPASVGNVPAAQSPAFDWNELRRQAGEYLATRRVFESRVQRHRYQVTAVADDRITVDRLDANAPAILTRGVAEAAWRRFVAAGTRARRRRLIDTVALESAFVELHPTLDWDATGEWIEARAGDAGTPAVPAATNDYCELWRPTGWRVVLVTHALARPDALVRCVECKGAVRLHTAGPEGVPRAHAEHLTRHSGCSLGHYFSGERSPHPRPVIGPDRERQDPLRSVIQTEDDESAFPEGQEAFGHHRYLERDGRLPRRAKAARLTATGKLSCDVCEFDFTATYGSLGDGYIEAHHRVPVHQLKGLTTTKIADLALVCANCHRMLHRADPQLSVEELRALLRQIPTDARG